MKKVFVLCLILTLWGNRKATAIGQCEDGWCCRCSHTAGCVRVTANQWGSTSCTQDCPGPILGKRQSKCSLCRFQSQQGNLRLSTD
jgi:hypothetical protein